MVDEHDRHEPQHTLAPASPMQGSESGRYSNNGLPIDDCVESQSCSAPSMLPSKGHTPDSFPDDLGFASGDDYADTLRSAIQSRLSEMQQSEFASEPASDADDSGDDDEMVMVQGAPSEPRPPPLHSGGAQDCAPTSPIVLNDASDDSKVQNGSEQEIHGLTNESHFMNEVESHNNADSRGVEMAPRPPEGKRPHRGGSRGSSRQTHSRPQSTRSDDNF